MSFRTLYDLDLSQKTILLRGDLNVPMESGKVTDTTRIDRLVPTLKMILEKGGKPVILSHFGRPKGKPVPEMSLKPVLPALENAIGVPITFAPECIGEATAAIIKNATGPVLLENLRFHKGEEANEAAFAKALADLGDIYVNDAFSAAHRAHASTHALAQCLPAVAGLNMQAELEALESALGSPKHPVAALVGGAKVSSKLKVLEHLVEKVDLLIIGGGMANTFLYAQGFSIGKSLCEPDLAETARSIIARADHHECTVALPQDVVVAPDFGPSDKMIIYPVEAVPEDHMILDIGPKSAQALADHLEKCATLIWNGPLGAFEISPFDQATTYVAQKAAALTKAGQLVSIAGGGDTVAALNHAGCSDQFSYVSTAGGAFLEWMEGRILPGVAVLMP